MKINQACTIITGAASGIGLALLQRLSASGARIVAADIRKEPLEQICSQLAGVYRDIIPFVGDLSIKEQVDDLFTYAQSTFGNIDLFIANAGFPYYELLRVANWNHIEQIFQLNVFSPIYSFQKMRQLQPNGKWKLVIVASAMGLMAMPGYALYSATKAALHRFSEGIRLEMDNQQQLMVVYPITTRTGFFKAAGGDPPVPWPSLSPESVADCIVRGIRNDRREVMPSRLFALILFLNRFQPFIRIAYQRFYARFLKRA
jgi:short-subunit dehydrogenase